MSLEDSSMWVRIFEGTLSGENFKITEDNRPQVVIPINVFSYYYKVKVETEQAKPWWWLAGTLVERVGTSSEIDRLEINRYVIPSNREILLRPTFNNRAFYYIFEPAYWHTKIFVQLWVYIDDPENVQYVNFLDVDEPSQGDIWTNLATKNYVQELFSGHLSLTNPHGITPEMIGAVTQQEIDAALTSHLAAIDPHPQYLTQERGDFYYAPKVATQNAITSHQGASNPHGITPDAIGAAAASHTHLAGDITGGALSILRGGTGNTTAVGARMALGAAEINHGHAGLPVPPSFYSGWTPYHDTYAPSYTILDKLVILCGLVKRISGAGTRIMLLETNLRPSKRKLFICWGTLNNSYTVVRIDVATDGIVYVIHPQVTNVVVNWISLDGIAFCIA